MSAKKKEKVEYLGLGRRKTAVARVRITEGTGNFIINGRNADEYCYTDELMMIAKGPLEQVGMTNDVDIRVLVEGGGLIGQAGAISLGIARALQKLNEELRVPLKKAGFLKRDPRMKERKKPGQPGARKRFQFSKR